MRSGWIIILDFVLLGFIVIIKYQKPLGILLVRQPPTYVDQNLFAVENARVLYIKDYFDGHLAETVF